MCCSTHTHDGLKSRYVRYIFLFFSVLFLNSASLISHNVVIATKSKKPEISMYSTVSISGLHVRLIFLPSNGEVTALKPF